MKPSVTDYATFVATTSKVLGTTGPASRKTRPNERVLSLIRPIKHLERGIAANEVFGEAELDNA